VLIGFLPAARITDMATCVGPPDSIAKGSPTVLIGNLMAARIGDLTVHGGVIVMGEPTVMIGEVGAGSPVSVDSGMGRVMAAMSQTSSGGSETGTGGDTGGAGGSNSPQAAALADAANEGTATVEKCPYAEH